MARPKALVLGAGAAGLAAARGLARAGWAVTVLEARPRLGGRIHTRRDPEWPLPVELGAEFVHGAGSDVRAVADEASLPVEELPDLHVFSDRGRWRPMQDFLGVMEKALAPAARLRRDVAFSEYLRRSRLPRRVRELARLYVEGYDAADPERVSARWLGGGVGGSDEASLRQHRIVAGYAALVRWLAATLDPQQVDVRLNTIATRVAWRRGEVTVNCRTVTGHPLPAVRGRALIVTVPVGVLKATPGQPGAIEFTPEPASTRRALAGLEMGHVCKVVLRFRDRFWERQRFLGRRLPPRKRGPEGGPINFWHDALLDLPTWWTAAPRHAPVLTAWAGGPRAEALLGRSDRELVGRTLDALSALMRMPRARLEAGLEAWDWHDWRADPFSRGAYSYVSVGGEAAAAALARPVQGTLFFAGEAADPEESGTVQAALASGRRAARQLAANALR